MPTTVTKVDLSGGEFGETYHIGAAMILAKYVNTADTPDTPDTPAVRYMITYDDIYKGKPTIKGGTTNPMTPSQLTFLNAIINSPSYSNRDEGNGTPTLSKGKCTEDIIAPAFANAPNEAIQSVKKCFLGESILNFVTSNVKFSMQLLNCIKSNYNQLNSQKDRAIIWIRNNGMQSRNTTQALVEQIETSLKYNTNIKEIILVGDDITFKNGTPKNYICLTKFQDDVNFSNIWDQTSAEGENFSISGQLNVLMLLHFQFQAKMQIGMKSGAMDGPAFIGMPTIFFEENNGITVSRMGKAAAAIPWMEQVSYKPGNYDATNTTLDKMPKDVIDKLNTAITKLNNL